MEFQEKLQPTVVSVTALICMTNTVTLAPGGMMFSSLEIESVQTFHCPCPSLWKQ